MLGLLILAAGTIRSDAAENPEHPGLPLYNDGNAWTPARSTGLNYSATAKQWIRIPALFNVASDRPTSPRSDLTCDPNSWTQMYPYKRITDYTIRVQMGSTPGAPEPYGIVGPFPVRSLAFGIIPVEVSLELRQLRDEDNLPIAIVLQQSNAKYCPGLGPNATADQEESVDKDIRGAGQLEIVVDSLIIDNQDVGISETCRTKSPSTLTLTAPDRYSLDPSSTDPIQNDPLTATLFGVLEGGLLTGNVEIPSFENCFTRSGEDISAILTAAISGPENPLQLRSDGIVERPGEDRTQPFPALPIPSTRP